MCQAFSCIITIAGDCYWKAGLDSHEDIIDLFKPKDKLLIDDKDPADFVRVEINPENNDYLNPYGKWIFKLNGKKPKWFNNKFEPICWIEFEKWRNEVYSSFNWKDVKNPINPFEIEPPKKITKKHLALLKQWDSVWASVRASVWASVWASVGDSVRDSVWASVWDSVLAYCGTFFPNIKEWKYTDKIKIKSYPYQSCVDLWKIGLVPSYDGNEWRLRSKNGIEWQGKI